MEKTRSKEGMLKTHLISRGITDERILSAFKEVPREEFVPERYRDLAYADMPLEIGEGQTISQPYTVAFMTQLLDPRPGDTVLEIGTGSGYQAAILSKLVKKVYTIEYIESLAKGAEEILRKLGYKNIKVIVGDGSKGLPEHAPYDGIIITAAAPEISKPLLEQLRVGGRLVAPVGWRFLQTMVKATKTEEGLEVEGYSAFRFVPLVGEYGFPTI